MAKQLNRNNFLTWSGSFSVAPFSIQAVADMVNIIQTAESVEISPLANDSATNGIDETSLVITLQDNPSRPATWNSSTRKITYYLPQNAAPGAHTLKYKFKDLNGNESQEQTITVNIIARPTSWRGYGPSYSCELANGVRTGNGVYAQLVKYYTDDMTNVAPQELKPNSVGDPNYIAPASDVNCSNVNYYQWSLTNDDVNSVCQANNALLYYTNRDYSYLTSGILLFYDTALTQPVAQGYYSDGSQIYRVVNGQIVNVSACERISQ